MPFNLAQWTGIAVTVIVVSGTDMDIVYAVPLGLLAGAFATFFSSLAERYRPETERKRPAAVTAAPVTAEDAPPKG